MKPALLLRLIFTVAIIVAWGVLGVFLNATHTVASAEIATGQFANSDTAASASQTSMAIVSRMELPTILLLAILVAIWFVPLRNLVQGSTRTTLAVMAVVGVALATSTPARAYYNTTDRTEVVYILPNWSAFFIPDAGANQSTQAAFGSVQYLEANKIAAKRFIIPHAKLSGTGGNSMFSGPDYYVPTGRMIVVDRTPFFREWVDAADRGTSTRKEGFSFETLDSVNISTGITISASVSPENAATFLYWFGTHAVAGDANDPAVQFESVLKGMSLEDVMDGIVRAKVQQALAYEFGRRKFDDAIAQKGDIINAVQTALKSEFGPKGITIGFVGYAGALEFSDRIQQAIDETIVASREKTAAATLKDAMPVLQQKAVIDGFLRMAAKFDGRIPALPSFVALPEGLMSTLLGTTSTAARAVPATR